MTFAKRIAIVAIGGCALVLPATSGNAQQTTPEEAIKARQQHFKDIGKAAKEIVDQIKSGTIDKAVVAARAAEIDADLKGIPTWFPCRNRPGSRGLRPRLNRRFGRSRKNFERPTIMPRQQRINSYPSLHRGTLLRLEQASRRWGRGAAAVISRSASRMRPPRTNAVVIDARRATSLSAEVIV